MSSYTVQITTPDRTVLRLYTCLRAAHTFVDQYNEENPVGVANILGAYSQRELEQRHHDDDTLPLY